MEAEALRIGFGNLKHIGLGQAQAIVSERAKGGFASLHDLIARVELHQYTRLALAFAGYWIVMEIAGAFWQSCKQDSRAWVGTANLHCLRRKRK